MPLFFAAKSMAKNSKGDSSNDPKASTDSSTTIEDDDSKGQLVFFSKILFKYFHSKFHIILSFVPFDIFTKNLKIMIKPISNKHIFVPKKELL